MEKKKEKVMGRDAALSLIDKKARSRIAQGNLFKPEENFLWELIAIIVPVKKKEASRRRK